MKGRLVKVCSNGYIVNSKNEEQFVRARGKLKTRGEGLFVGDYVEVENGAITKVFPRKNYLIRPRVSNVDGIMLVLASQPKPDYYLIDKVILSGEKNNLETLIVVNKLDDDKEVYEEILSQYNGVCKVKGVSAKLNTGLDELRDFLKNKTVVLAGQSAVGKTSIINALFSLNLKVGDLSEKISRGKHTTTYSQIYSDNDISIIDSPGFAQIDADVDIEDLPFLYDEYFKASQKCRFRGCTHIDEPDCEVKRLVEEGKLPKDRYNRYREIYNEIKKRRKDYE